VSSVDHHTEIKLTFCSHDYFDFLSLPLEIRLMIYGFIMAGWTGRVKKGKVHPVSGLAFLTVNKQVSAEAMMAMKERQYVVDFGKHTHMTPDARAALQYFRCFYLKVPVRRGNATFEWGGRSDFLYKFLRKILDQLIVGHTGAEKMAKMTIHVAFMDICGLSNRLLRGDDVFDPTGRFSCETVSLYSDIVDRGAKYTALYYKTHLQAFVDEMRNELATKLPNAELSSNADMEWGGVEVSIVDKQKISFKDTAEQCMGTVAHVVGGRVTTTFKYPYDAKAELESRLCY
jgi:hypothetical protein